MIHDRITYSNFIHILNTEMDTQSFVGVDGYQFATFVNCGLIRKGILETYVEFN